jgi:hypothetical protein
MGSKDPFKKMVKEVGFPAESNGDVPDIINRYFSKGGNNNFSPSLSLLKDGRLLISAIFK